MDGTARRTSVFQCILNLDFRLGKRDRQCEMQNLDDIGTGHKNYLKLTWCPINGMRRMVADGSVYAEIWGVEVMITTEVLIGDSIWP